MYIPVRELGLLQVKKTKKRPFQCKREFNYHNYQHLIINA
jgi:hypothetical protein